MRTLLTVTLFKSQHNRSRLFKGFSLSNITLERVSNCGGEEGKNLSNSPNGTLKSFSLSRDHREGFWLASGQRASLRTTATTRRRPPVVQEGFAITNPSK